MKLTREEAMDKMKAAFPKVSEEHFRHTPIGVKGLLLCLEALGLVEIIEPPVRKTTLEEGA